MVFNRDRRKQSTRVLPGHLERRAGRNETGARQHRAGFGARFKGYLANHRSVAKVSLQRLLAVPAASIMTWGVIAIALALPAGLYVLLHNAQQLSSGWDSPVQISVYLEMGASKEQARRLNENISKRPDVAKTSFISADQALQEFRESSGFGDAVQYLDENPLPSVIVVHPVTVTGSASAEILLRELQVMSGVDQAQLDLEWVQRLYSIMALGRRAALVLGFLLSLAVLLVIGNTIRLAIEARRAEIVVVKLVGGTDGFVRRPFLYTGIWYGLGGGILAWILINLVMLWLSSPVTQLVSAYNSEFDPSGLGFLPTMLLLLTSGLLGLFGAWIAVGRHLSDIEPR